MLRSHRVRARKEFPRPTLDVTSEMVGVSPDPEEFPRIVAVQGRSSDPGHIPDATWTDPGHTPRVAAWSTLSAIRWGPSLEHDLPGLDVGRDRPLRPL
jgi:hypothetical protein